jgi:hypothetical protein
MPLHRCLSLSLASLLLAGCYTYTPLHTIPEPGVQVALDLNDRGRVAMADSIGPEIARVEGTLVSKTDSLWVLRMNGTEGIRGGHVKWSGEQIGFRPDHVRSISERKFSKQRTALVAGSAAAAVVAFVASRDLFGFGGGDNDRRDPGGGGGGGETKRGKKRSP